MQSTSRRNIISSSSMTSSSHSHSHSHVYHHAKFRWTENLTCRFIQLRKEHGNMFTGRKYSAQAGWEYILRQMREEFPSIMADVHYRVLKKKWSNLLQQYKELKNPVHGDKNKADDISWPFYAAIDEVLGGTSTPLSEPIRQESDLEEDDEEEELNPQEFLCVSVDNDEDEDDESSLNLYNHQGTTSKVPGLEPLRRGHVFDIERTERTATRRSSSTASKTNKRAASDLLSRLPRATELTIRPIRRCSSELPPLEPIATAAAANGRSCRKRGRTAVDERDEEASRESKLERKIGEFLEYTKKRDEENRNILLRMLEVVEDIRNSVR